MDFERMAANFDRYLPVLASPYRLTEIRGGLLDLLADCRGDDGSYVVPYNPSGAGSA